MHPEVGHSDSVCRISYIIITAFLQTSDLEQFCSEQQIMKASQPTWTSHLLTVGSGWGENAVVAARPSECISDGVVLSYCVSVCRYDDGNYRDSHHDGVDPTAHCEAGPWAGPGQSGLAEIQLPIFPLHPWNSQALAIGKFPARNFEKNCVSVCK